MPSTLLDKKKDKKKEQRKAAKKLDKHTKNMPAESKEQLAIVSNDEEKELMQAMQLKNAIELERIGIPVEFLPEEIRPPTLLRQKACQIVNGLSREEMIYRRMLLERQFTAAE